MARARNIKPSFFTNDELAEIDPLGRLLFIALWTMADRDGRLEDRPKRIKAEALPYDDCDADALLECLHERGFILRYSVDSARFIQVVNFAKHQNPHVKEGASQIPAPDEHGASTVQAQCETQPKPERARRIPDSGFPFPDSPSRIPDGESAQPAAKRSPTGSRLPSDFPAEPEIAWCRQERPDLDAAEVREKFRDYWSAVPGAKGRKLDWPATWRNFVRSEFSRYRPPARASPQSGRAAVVAQLTGRANPPEIVDVEPATTAIR